MTFSSSARAAADPRKRFTNWRASSSFRAAPSLKMISRSCSSASSNGTWIAPQGSSAAPTLQERRGNDIAAGFSSVPLRPMNSVLSPVKLRVVLSTSKNAIRSPNSSLYELPAKSAPLSGSISVITCIIDFGRSSPSTHSMYPVTERRRNRPDLLRTFKTANLIGASSATYTHSSESMPSSVWVNTLYPNPCRQT